ncbi:MAG: hypothetical protein DRG31_02395, partial [Deltaproteobacteria bacterium]
MSMDLATRLANIERRLHDLLRKHSELERELERIKRTTLEIPHVEYGVLEVRREGWVRVNFKNTFTEPPVFLAVGEARPGTWKGVGVSELTPAEFPLPTVPQIPEIPMPDVERVMGEIEETITTHLNTTFDSLLKEINRILMPIYKLKRDIVEKLKNWVSTVMSKLRLPEIWFPPSLLPAVEVWDVDWYTITTSYGARGSRIASHKNLFPPMFYFNWGEGIVYGRYSNRIGFVAKTRIYVPYIMPLMFKVVTDDGIRVKVRKVGEQDDWVWDLGLPEIPGARQTEKK